MLQFDALNLFEQSSDNKQRATWHIQENTQIDFSRIDRSRVYNYKHTTTIVTVINDD